MSTMVRREIVEFAIKNRMNVSESDGSSVIDIGGRRFIPLSQSKVFDSNMNILVDEHSRNEAQYYQAEYVFEFGGNYYWTPFDSKVVQFNDFRYIGNCMTQIEIPYAHLGIHGGYEIMNGTGSYDLWCQKAKFYGHNHLGICEHNTLAGAVAFQNSCDSSKIKPVIGMSITATFGGSWKHKCKLYAQDGIGWRSLLKIHKRINVDGDSDTVDLDFVLSNSSGIVFVFGWGAEMTNEVVSAALGAFKEGKVYSVYYQIDSIIYADQMHELSVLSNAKRYISNYMEDIPPILINDTYYLDSDYSHIKNKLNASSGKFHNKCKNAHYKNSDETFESLSELFDEDDDRLYHLFETSVNNAFLMSEKVSFKIETGVVKMPRFECGMVEGKYAGRDDNESLFWDIINDRIEELGDVVTDEYYDRLEMEVGVIKNGGFIDYFLTVWDIIRWCTDNGIYVGVGRGSAGGSLVSYLMGIIRINPMTYGLPFERFMNAGRLVGSLPDIDSDFEGLRRDDVKRYIESKYGADYVCSVGTYSKLRVKAAMLELWKDRSKSGTINLMSKLIVDRDGDWDEIFRSSNKKKLLKDFVLENPEFINDIRIVLDQPKNVSIHAAAVIIVPKTDKDGNPMTIFDWMPVTKRDGVLISEWEGEYLEKCGFMKNDILGTRQLDKFRFMTNIIKETSGDDVDIYNVPVDDKYVFEMFSNGNTEDTFHFGSSGLKSYTRSLKPTSIYDLIDTISLFRPGIMDVGMHKEYINIKHGVAKPKYDFGLESITKDTNGVLIYQEQIMEAVKQIGGFTMAEADDVRRAMGKKKIEVIAPYKDQFVRGAIEKGCPPDKVDDLWHKLEVFSGYGFNRAHGTAYALTGYIGMWLKVKYPLQFWTAAFQYAKDDGDISNFVSEMSRTGTVTIAPPDINTSDSSFTTDYDSNTIYWSLGKIKQVGQVATEEIIGERTLNGKYYSFEEFFKRVTRKKVNKKVISALIFAGCMDKMCGISNPCDRAKIFKEYAKVLGVQLDEIIDTRHSKSTEWWVTNQKVVSGLGRYDYKSIAESSGFSSKYRLMDAIDIQSDDNIGKKCWVAGLVVGYNVHKGSKGEFANIQIDCNDNLVWITCWTDSWQRIRSEIVSAVNMKIIILCGKIVNDDFKGLNVIETIPSGDVLIIDTGVASTSKS